MDAIIISIKGNLKPIALRHHLYELGKTLGIRGFLNYRQGMFELYIHAEAEKEIMVEFRNLVKQIVKKHKLVCIIEAATLKKLIGFKISHIDVSLNHNFEDSHNSLIPKSIDIPSTEAQENKQQRITTKNKNQISMLGDVFSFIKHAGLW